jgi:hypothetical protein
MCLYVSILIFPRIAKYLIAKMTELLAKDKIPKIVKTQPFPIPWMIGAATTLPMQEEIFRRKLLTATPDEVFLGIISVRMVVTKVKMRREPIPKRKLPII